MRMLIRFCALLLIADICFAAALSPIQAYTLTWAIVVGIPVCVMVVLSTLLRPGGWSNEARNIESIKRFEELEFIRRYDNRK